MLGMVRPFSERDSGCARTGEWVPFLDQRWYGFGFLSGNVTKATYADSGE